MDEIARREQVASVVATMLRGVQNVQNQLPIEGGDPFMRLKDGKFSYGQERIEVQKGSKWAINMQTARWGFSKWEGNNDSNTTNKKLGEVLVSLFENMPPLTSLPQTHPEYEWREQINFELVCVSGEDKGTQVLYPMQSKGALRSIKERLMPIVNAQLVKEAQSLDPKIVPIVTLETGNYPHKKWGLVHYPIFNVVGWASLIATEVPETTAAPMKVERPPVQEDDGTVPFEPAQAAAPEGTRRRRR